MKNRETKVHTTKQGGVYIETKDLLSKPSVQNMMSIISKIKQEATQLEELLKKKKITLTAMEDNESNIINWVNLLEEKRTMAGFKNDDLEELLELKSKFDKDFEEYCRTATCVGGDDIIEHDLVWIAKAIRFFVERGYISEYARP